MHHSKPSQRTYRLIAFFVIFTLLNGAVPFCVAQETVKDPILGIEVVPGELVVTVHEGVKETDLQLALDGLPYEASVEERIAESNSYKVKVPVDAANECRIRLGNHPYVASCGLSPVRTIRPLFNDPALKPDSDHDWNIKRIFADKAWDVTTGGATIAVVDTGIRSDHEEFEGKLVDTYSVYTRSRNLQTGPVKVRIGDALVDDFITNHGSHVAGTAAGLADNGVGTAGIAPASPIMPIQVLTYDPGSERILATSDGPLVEGLHRAIDQGAKVINYSIGGPPPDNLLDPWKSATTATEKANAEWMIMEHFVKANLENYKAVLDKAQRNGVVFVKSAGNDNLPAKFDYLSWSGRVLSVAATNKKDERALFGNDAASNYGPTTTVSAPGQEIWNASSDPANPYVSMQGTSMAAPHVAGVVALMKTIDPELSPREAADILVTTGKQLNTDQPVGPLVNAQAALAELKRRRDNNVPRPPDWPPLVPEPPVDPRSPDLPPDGEDICNGPRPWENADVRRLIDLWLCFAVPITDLDPANGPYFFDRFGRVVSIEIILTIGPPENATRRYQWIWENGDDLNSRNLGTVFTFVIRMMRDGDFSPVPPPDLDGESDEDPGDSELNGNYDLASTFTGISSKFDWKQTGENTASITVHLDGQESTLLKQYGLPASVVITATKSGDTYTVPENNPLSTALNAAGAKLSQSLGGTPADVNISFTFTKTDKGLTVTTKHSNGITTTGQASK